MIKLKVDGSGMFNKISRALTKLVDVDGQIAVERLKDAIVLNTPIRTGYARSRWTLAPTTEYKMQYTVSYSGVFFREAKFTISNDAPYIARLNQGSSRQAPAFFIESTIMSQGFKINSTVVS